MQSWYVFVSTPHPQNTRLRLDNSSVLIMLIEDHGFACLVVVFFGCFFFGSYWLTCPELSQDGCFHVSCDMQHEELCMKSFKTFAALNFLTQLKTKLKDFWLWKKPTEVTTEANI